MFRRRRSPTVVVRPASEDPGQAHASDLLAETREELARADQKASILLGAATVALGLVAAPLAAADGWKPADLELEFEAVFWTGVGMAVLGLLLLGLAVYPLTATSRLFFWLRRSKRPVRHERADYFGDLAEADSLDTAKRMTFAAAGDRFDRTVSQSWILSKVVTTKYAYTRWAFRSYGLSGLLVGWALIAGQ